MSILELWVQFWGHPVQKSQTHCADDNSKCSTLSTWKSAQTFVWGQARSLLILAMPLWISDSLNAIISKSVLAQLKDYQLSAGNSTCTHLTLQYASWISHIHVVFAFWASGCKCPSLHYSVNEVHLLIFILKWHPLPKMQVTGSFGRWITPTNKWTFHYD